MTIKLKTLHVLLLSTSLAFSGCGGGNSNSTIKTQAQLPNFTSTPPTSATQAVVYSYKVAATDPSGGTVSFALTSGPGSISSGTLTWTPTAAQTGVANKFTITATTSEGTSATQSWSVTPSTGPAPTFTSTPPTAASEGTAYNYDLSATDPLGGTVSFALTSGPGAITGAQLSWTPTHAQSRTADNFTLTASTPEGGTATQTWTVTPAGTINGSIIYTNVLASGNTVTSPQDLSGTPVNALLANGSQGYTILAGTGSSDGTFTIMGVPAGAFLVQLGNSYFQVSASDFAIASPDSGTYVAGRTGITYNGGASISLTATFPTPLGDVCDSWWVPNLNENQTAQGESCPGSPEDLSSAVFSEYIPLLALMDSSQGDEGFYLASTFDPAYTGSQQLVTSAYELGPNPVTATTGEDVGVTGAISTVPSTQSTEVAVQRSAFAELRSSANPTYTSATTTFWVQPQLYGNLYGPIFYEEPYALEFYDFSGATTNFDLGSIQFGLFDPSEPLLYEVMDSTFASSTVNGGILFQYGGVYVASGSPFTSLSPATPGVSPVSAPLLNGTSFFDNQSNVPSTPTLSWGAPTTGSPNMYNLTIYQTVLTNLCGSTPCQYWLPTVFTANFATTAKELTIPPGILQPGLSYQFDVYALDDPGWNILTQQATISFNWAGAYSYSGLITISANGGATSHNDSPVVQGLLPVQILRQQRQMQRQLQRAISHTMHSY